MTDTQIRRHALESYPEECVGYISGGEYHRLENVSNSPRESYSVSVEDRMMLYSLKEKLIALVHSHPVLDSTPSLKDLEAYKSTKFNFYIIGTDGITTTNIRRLIHE